VITKGNGKTIQWIRDHANYPHEDWCLIWPFSKTRGYGTFSYLGKHYYAHVFMCELAHGPAPTDQHESAHSCGDAGCINPRHLSWKTPTENGLDSRKHGTHVRSRYGNAGKITREQAGVIRGLKGVKTLRELADEYGVSESAISNVWVGKTHYRPSKMVYWSPTQEQQLRDGIAAGMNFTQIAKILGKNSHTVSSKAYRLGLKSGASVVSPADRGSP
jgi:hypothetical protein